MPQRGGLKKSPAGDCPMYSPDVADVHERISFQHNQVSSHSRFDQPAVGNAQNALRKDRGRSDRLQRAQAGLHQQLQLSMQTRTRHNLIAAGEDWYPGVVQNSGGLERCLKRDRRPFFAALLDAGIVKYDGEFGRQTTYRWLEVAKRATLRMQIELAARQRRLNDRVVLEKQTDCLFCFN